MSENEKMKIADEADMIIRGFAFRKKEDYVQIVNLNKSDSHVVNINYLGKMLESSMDPIEEKIAISIWKENSEFMEVMNA